MGCTLVPSYLVLGGWDDACHIFHASICSQHTSPSLSPAERVTCTGLVSQTGCLGQDSMTAKTDAGVCKWWSYWLWKRYENSLWWFFLSFFFFLLCCSLNVCVPTHVYVEVPQCGCIWRGGFKEIIMVEWGQRVGPGLKGWWPYKKEDYRAHSLSLATHTHRGKARWGHREKGALCNPRGESSPCTNLDLALPGSRAVRK